MSKAKVPSREECPQGGVCCLDSNPARRARGARPGAQRDRPSPRLPLASLRVHLGQLRAFTLIETLLAVALMGALLLALNFFVFSMADIWGQGAERRLFEQHVRAVTREVESLLRAAALPPLLNDPPIFAREIRLDDGRRVTPLTFELPEGSPRLPWPETALPDVVCSLVQQDGKGLMLYWQSRLEEKFDEAAPRAFTLSPFGAGLTYEYNEADGTVWRTYDQLQRTSAGQWNVPGRLRLKFVHGKMQAETTVVLPPSPGPMPHF